MTKRPTFRLPTVATVAEAIHDHWTSMAAEAYEHRWSEADDDDERSNGPDRDAENDTTCDVRLWATSSDRSGNPSSYGVEFGDASYDQTHGDLCASDCIELADEPDHKLCEAIAREMLANLRAQREDFNADFAARHYSEAR